MSGVQIVALGVTEHLEITAEDPSEKELRLALQPDAVRLQQCRFQGLFHNSALDGNIARVEIWTNGIETSYIVQTDVDGFDEALLNDIV